MPGSARSAASHAACTRPRFPQGSLLHRVVREQLETFLDRGRSRGHPAPRFVEQELEAFLRCGILAHGFLRLHCDECQLDRLVPFSCKRRGFCPSCGGRRMSDTAAHLVDRVLPEVPVRQWVLTLPYPLRYRCAYDAALTSEVLGAFVRALFAELRRRARRQWSLPRAQCGAVTFIQRFGSALNLNVHFHTLALDGVYAIAEGVPQRFRPLPPPSAEEVTRVLAGTARRIAWRVEARAEDDEDVLAREEPLLATLAAASLRTRISSGPHAGERWRRLGDRVEPEPDDADPEASPRVPQHGGMSLHADVAVPARDRRRLERLCRYVARPPLAAERLEELPDGRLALRLKTPWRDGTTHVLMERHELLDRLVPLIPPPRAHQVRYHGVLAPCASARDRVVPIPMGPQRDHEAAASTCPSLPTTSPTAGDSGEPAPSDHAIAVAPPAEVMDAPLPQSPEAAGRPSPARADVSGPSQARVIPAPPRARRLPWAELLQRVFGVDALCCPRCGARMRLLAVMEDPEVARKILACLGLPARAPPMGASRVASAEPEGASWEDPSWMFDQRRPDDGEGA